MKLGVLGGGQLARMLALSGLPLGIKLLCLDPAKDACTKDICQTVTAELTDQTILEKLASSVDCVTFETENIPLSTARTIAEHVAIYPSIESLAVAQDRLQEKQFFNDLNIQTAKFVAIDDVAQLTAAIEKIDLPAVLKTRRLGYDGKGQYVIKTQSQRDAAWQTLAQTQQPLILEEFIDFDYECSLIAVRNKKGDIAFYPLAKNEHCDGILFSTVAPFVDAKLQQQAEQHMQVAMQALQYVGVMAIEFFCKAGQLIINEMAPRVHNSGHWTIEGAQTSQFENHLRALFDLPLGSTQAVGQSFLINCIGELLPKNECLAIPGLHYHDYGKAARAQRKVGHVNLVDCDAEQFVKNKQRLLGIIKKYGSHDEVAR